ncbi:681_t:CDS:2 [Ambispora gerdemannii]|uniref:AP-1 complex subunit sigma-1 n=1 Tax=Ambispora gerdemannii TaxID=144530 RepID=A0A9N9FA29_9GLOM|nr:681_t:CDS:2 [Ambispora gerdemannii]
MAVLEDLCPALKSLGSSCARYVVTRIGTPWQTILSVKMIFYVVIFSRHGKIRLKKWYHFFSERQKTLISTELTTLILSRKRSMCNVLEFGEHKVIYKRYASLYFAAGIDWDENELYVLEVIHRYVQVLDEYFGNVCELDIIYNFDKAYQVLDELIMGGEMQEPSRKAIVRHVTGFEKFCELDVITTNLKNTVMLS